jgi:AcrR family transcriptional regulator
MVTTPKPVPKPAPRSARTELSPKAEETRRSIIDAALRLFLAGGYDATTMRAVATEAGVSLGSAYYYFDSKEHLVQGFYDRLYEAHAAAAAEIVANQGSFGARMSGLLLAWIDIAEPYHEFAGKFFKNAAEPTSPLSPFSADSTPARESSIDLYRQVIEGSDLKVAPALRDELPTLLWLLQMGVVLFWVHDTSKGQVKTRELVTGLVPVIEQLVRLSRLPILRGLTTDLVSLVISLRP